MKREVDQFYPLFIWLVVACGGLGVVNAQTRPTEQLSLGNEVKMAIKAHNYGDSIVLRWGINQGAYWLAANEKGYILERLEYETGRSKPTRKQLTVAPIRPWSLDSMKKRLAKNDRFVAIAAQVLHGKTYKEQVKNEAVGLYKTHQEQQGKLLLAAMAAEFSAGAANALGLRWVDRSFRKDAHSYVYRLWINNGPKPKSNDLRDTVTVVVFPGRIDSVQAPKIAGVVAGDHKLTVSWYKYHSGGTFSGYYIERSADGKTFKRLNETPFVAGSPDTTGQATQPVVRLNQVDFTDSVNQNYRKFYYRIIGINSFGDLSPASKLLVGSARDLTPPAPPTNLRKEIQDNRRIIISWDLPTPAPDLKGFVVGRADDVNGPFQPLTQTMLPASARRFVDEKPVPYLGRYYAIAAVDTAGNQLYSMPLAAQIEDRTPPAPPRNLSAKVDTNGIVTLRWPTNTEPDVIGYKLYRSYRLDNPYYQQLASGEFIDTVFVDSLPTNTLTRQAFYKLVAVDMSNNHSEFSLPIEVAIPDKIPPATPIIKEAIVAENTVRLTIIPSLSDDVAEHTVSRRTSGGSWQPIRKISGKPIDEQVIVDSTVAHNTAYEYAVTARDQRGLLSPQSFVVSIRYVNLNRLAVAAPTQVRAVYDPQQKGIRVEWASQPAGANHHFLLYRGINGQSVSAYKTVKGGASFTDTDLSAEGVYTYAVRLILSEKQSTLSEAGSITYRK